jgi:hypothetical protein
MPGMWSTEDVHPRNRVAYWVDGLCDTIVHVDCEPRSGQPFIRSDDDSQSGLRTSSRGCS